MGGITPSEHVSELLQRLQSEFDWSHTASRYDVVSSWERPRSGSKFLHLRGTAGGPEVVVKWSLTWPANTARQLYDAMVELAEIVERAETEDCRAIRPLAWSSSPEALVMPYVEGTDLVSVLRQPDHPAWRREAEQLKGWLFQVGRFLATYHASGPTPMPGDVTKGLTDLEAVARKARLDGRRLAGLRRDIDGVSRHGRLYGDFGPGNLEATTDGRLYVLDPPESAQTGLVHRDIGNFLFELRRQLAGRGYTRTPPVRGRLGGLRRAFLDGYSSAARGGPLTEADLAAIDLYEFRRALGMARKRWPRRLGDSLWFLGSAFARRIGLRRYSPE